MQNMSDHSSDDSVVIVSAFRTPIGSFNGALSSFKAHELSSILIRHILDQHKDIRPDDVLIGQALTADQGQNPARQASIGGGLPYSVPATTLNMVCGSGLKAVVMGYQSIKCGDANIVLCGGQESMSQAPHCVQIRNGKSMGNLNMSDTLINDGLTDAFEHVHMGITAEYVAQIYNVSREEQDEFALKSQEKSKSANEKKIFHDEIISVKVKTKKGDIVVDKDESPRYDSTYERLQKLNPCFKAKNEGGTITAGNSCPLNDGAAIMLLMRLSQARNYKLEPLVRIVSWSQSACEPLLMGICPIQSINDALTKAKWSINDVDLFEINEAFASQSVAVVKSLGVDQSKVNINGGSISLGHPIGCSGARILVTLIHSLKRNNLKRGVAALCIGGGMGIAMCVERL